MYSGLVQTVEIPKGKVKILKNGYVYWITKSHWDNDRKMTVDDRTIIGKLDPNDSTHMYPNKKYEKIFGPINEDVARAREKYDPAVRKLAGKMDSTLSYAPYAVMFEAFCKCGCKEALQKAFPSLWKKIFAVSLHGIVAQNSTAQAFPGWAFDNYCGLRSSISDSEISRLYSSIGKDTASVAVFFELYRKYYHRVFPKSGERVDAFDSTNQETDSKHQSRAKRGKSKEGGIVPIVNTAMFVDEETGIAQYYEHFDGNILDKSETPYTVEKAGELGFKKLFLMQDRGYYTQGNIQLLDKLGIGYGMMMPETTDFVGDLIRQHLPTIKLKEKYYIESEDIYGMAKHVDIGGKRYPAYIFYDDNTARLERDTIHGNVNYWMGEAEKRKNYTEKMYSYFSKRAIIVTKTPRDKNTGKNFKLDIDHRAVEESLKSAGAFVVLSNRMMKAEGMIRIARKRDHVEKAYRMLKDHFGLHRTYTHSDNTYDGKMFVAFVGLITLQSYSWFASPVLKAKTSETIETTVAELHKYKIMLKDNGSWMPAYACNKQQKELLSCFGLSQEVLEKQVRSIKLRV